MAVVTRVRKGGKKTYYVKFIWNDAERWELAGHDKRAARSLNAQRLQEVREGTYRPKEDSSPTVRAYVESWLDGRPARSRRDEEPVLRRHVLGAGAAWLADMPMERVRTADVRKLLKQWRATEAAPRGRPSGVPLSSKSVANIYSIVRQVFGDAHRREVLARDPFAGIARKEIKRKARGRRSRYALEAIRAVLTSEAVHPSGRVFAALAFLTGGRQGEVCGLLWSDWDIGAAPLTCLTIDKQYDGQPLKSDDEDFEGEHARKVPVHPVLADALMLWWREGFELVYGRPPRLVDPIVPSKAGTVYSRSGAYELFQRAIAAAGVVNMTLHVTRHTFISLARRRSLAETVEKITHNARGETIEQYTHKQWDELCEVVSLIDLNAPSPVTLLVTHVPQLLSEKVAPPGVEPGRLDVTIDTDSEPFDADDPPETRVSSASIPARVVQWDARHRRDVGGEDRTYDARRRSYYCASCGSHFDALKPDAGGPIDCPECEAPARELGTAPVPRAAVGGEARAT